MLLSVSILNSMEVSCSADCLGVYCASVVGIVLNDFARNASLPDFLRHSAPRALATLDIATPTISLILRDVFEVGPPSHVLSDGGQIHLGTQSLVDDRAFAHDENSIT